MNPRTGEQAGVRTIIIVLTFFLAGMALGAFLLYRSTRTAKPGAHATQPSTLSDGTRAVLQRLSSPVEIRFYSLLDPASVSESDRAFAGRVDSLLSEYQREGAGKINLTRHLALADPGAANAAAADGIKPFNLDKGDACFLGIAVACEGRKEALAQLFPEWEPALESDLTRAIARVMGSTPSASAVPEPPKTDKAALEEVKRLVPNFASVSVDDGMLTLREAALKDFQATASEAEIKVKEAQQRLAEAQKGGSDADKQAALKALQQLQAEQTEKLRQISARTQDSNRGAQTTQGSGPVMPGLAGERPPKRHLPLLIQPGS